jgi:hypothetical protein
MGELRLDDIANMSLVLGSDPHPEWDSRRLTMYQLDWIPEHLELAINGVVVDQLEFGGEKYGPGSHMDLGWPQPAKRPVTVLESSN